MSGLVCVAGGKGAPGATTLALALARVAAVDGPVRLVDADPDGGDLVALVGVSSDPGVATLAAASRHGFAGGELAGHVQSVTGGIELLAAPSSPEQAAGSLATLGRPFASLLASGRALVDVGRWRRRSPAGDLVREAAATVLVVRPTVAGVAHARFVFEDLAALCPRVVVACRGERPYGPGEVAAALGCSDVVSFPVDRVGVSMLAVSGSHRWSRRAALWRAVRALDETLHPPAAGVAS